MGARGTPLRADESVMLCIAGVIGIAVGLLGLTLWAARLTTSLYRRVPRNAQQQ